MKRNKLVIIKNYKDKRTNLIFEFFLDLMASTSDNLTAQHLRNTCLGGVISL